MNTARDLSEVETESQTLAGSGSDLVSDRSALVTGFTGQDGTFLTKLLLSKGYEVYGMVRRISTEPPRRVRGSFDFSEALASGQLTLVEGDLLSPDSLTNVVKQANPDEVYNLGAQSHVGESFKQPDLTAQTNYLGVINLISALENHSHRWAMYQASTSEMFGDRLEDTVLSELDYLNPISPYAIAKAGAHQYCKMKRQQGRFISNGILFNHESEIRGGDFVTQKIVRGAKQWFKNGDVIELGNLDARRDWGYAGDYVEAMWLMLQQDKPDDYVVATGETHSVREFAEVAFKALGRTLEWEGNNGWVDGQKAVRVNPTFYRPNEVGFLNGDSSKIRALGWRPKVSFNELVGIMVEEL